jgi:hypothetical protein
VRSRRGVAAATSSIEARERARSGESSARRDPDDPAARAIVQTMRVWRLFGVGLLGLSPYADPLAIFRVPPDIALRRWVFSPRIVTGYARTALDRTRNKNGRWCLQNRRSAPTLIPHGSTSGGHLRQPLERVDLHVADTGQIREDVAGERATRTAAWILMRVVTTSVDGHREHTFLNVSVDRMAAPAVMWVAGRFGRPAVLPAPRANAIARGDHAPSLGTDGAYASHGGSEAAGIRHRGVSWLEI